MIGLLTIFFCRETEIFQLYEDSSGKHKLWRTMGTGCHQRDIPTQVSSLNCPVEMFVRVV